MRSRRVGRWMMVLILLVAGACGDDADDVVAEDGDQADRFGPRAAQGDGLALRIAGSIESGLLCPGGSIPCLAFRGDVEPSASGDFVWVGGRLLDGTFIVDDQAPLPNPFGRDYSNRCADTEITAAPGEVAEMMHEGLADRPPGFVDLWDSDGVLHLGVADDGAAARAFLEDLGFADVVCIVPGFPYTDELLESAQSAVVEAMRRLEVDSFGVSRDGWQGTLTLDTPRADGQIRSALTDVSVDHERVPIVLIAGVEVLNGTLDDYEAALAGVAAVADPADRLVARCGSVEFSTIPADLDEFPPLDTDAAAALDELVNGPTGVEAAGFDTDFEWSVAARSDTELVLFGQGPRSEEGPVLVIAAFDRRDGAWTPTSWGGCRIQIDAPGFGPAVVAIDPDRPPDPDSTVLALLIQEQSCASGQAPTDRQVEVIATETPDTVTIVALVEPVRGSAECPGNPWHPVAVTLDAALGSRGLLDGSSSPPGPVGVPE